MAQNFVLISSLFQKFKQAQSLYTDCNTMCKLKNKFKIMAYIKCHVSLNSSGSQMYYELCQIHRHLQCPKEQLFDAQEISDIKYVQWC